MDEKKDAVFNMYYNFERGFFLKNKHKQLQYIHYILYK